MPMMPDPVFDLTSPFARAEGDMSLPEICLPLVDRRNGNPAMQPSIGWGEYGIPNITTIISPPSGLDLLCLRLEECVPDHSWLKTLDDQGLCGMGKKPHRNDQTLTIADDAWQYARFYKSGNANYWQVTLYPNRFRSKADMDWFLESAFPNFRQKYVTITELHFQVDLGVPFKEFVRTLYLPRKKNLERFSNEADSLTNGTRFGVRGSYVISYDKALRGPKAVMGNAGDAVFRPRSRIEAQLKGKSRLPLHRYDALENLVDFEPFPHVKFLKTTINKAKAFDQKNLRLYDRLAWVDCICNTQSLTHARRHMSRDDHYRRLVKSGHITFEPINLDLNAQFKKDFSRFVFGEAAGSVIGGGEPSVLEAA